MKFLVDAQLPPGLCSGLAKRGHQSVHVVDALSGAASDTEVAEFARREGCILITKDDDFQFRMDAFGLQVVWLRIGNASNRVLTQWLEAHWQEVEDALCAGETLIEVR